MNVHERVPLPVVEDGNTTVSPEVQTNLDTISDVLMMVRTHHPELTARTDDFESLVQTAVHEYLDASTDSPVDTERQKEAEAKIAHLEQELVNFAESAGLQVEEVSEPGEASLDSVDKTLVSLQTSLETKLSTIKRYEYGPAGELLHEPTPEEKNLLQKGRSLTGQLRILQNQLARVRGGVAQVKEDVLVARAALLEQSVTDLLATSAPSAPAEGGVSEPLVLDERYRVAEEGGGGDAVPAVAEVVLPEPASPSPAVESVGTGTVVRIENLYQKEREALQREVDELVERETLPEPAARILAVIKTEMLTRLRLLSIRDEQYVPLRDRIKASLEQAKALLGLPEPVAVPKIDGVPNRYLAPHFEKLQGNQRFKAALLVALLASLTPGKVSEVQYVEAGLGMPQPRTVLGIGDQAAWGSGVPEVVTTKLTVKEVTHDVAPEVPKIIVEPPIPRVIDEVIEGEVVLLDEVAPVPFLDTSVLDTVQGDNLPSIDDSVPTVAETLPDRYVAVVVEGDVATYPDNQLAKFFATIDTKDLPLGYVQRLQAETKNHFYSDVDALRNAGISSGEADVVFPGEKINYEQPVEAYKAAVSSALELLAAPHTEVVKAGSDITTAILESYASDLSVVPAGERAAVVAEALTAYSVAEPNAAEALGVSTLDEVDADSIIDLRPLASYLSTAVAEHVRRVIDTDAVTESVEAGADTENVTEVQEVVATITPETYPGGTLAFSKDYQTFVASLGITGARSSWFDAMFSPAGPTSEALLGETVGDLTKLMIGQSPDERAEALAALGISDSTAKRVYDVIVAERAAGRLPAALDNDTTIETVLKNVVLQSASQTI